MYTVANDDFKWSVVCVTTRRMSNQIQFFLSPFAFIDNKISWP